MASRQSSDICRFCIDTICQSERLWGYHQKSWDALRESDCQACLFCSALVREIEDCYTRPQHLQYPLYRWHIRRETRIRETQEIVSLTFRPLNKTSPESVGGEGGSLPEKLFHFYLEHDLADVRDIADLGDRTDSEETWKQIRHWMSDCTTGHGTHSKCRRKPDPKPFHPTRLLDISDIDPDTKLGMIRLADTAKDHIKGDYVTLSHKWGSHKFMANSANTTKELTRGFGMGDARLTTNFREAIQTARRLQIGYIWIDSMCILQDSPEDFSKEAPRMHDYYQRSYCNIAASDAVEPENGLFRSRTSKDKYPLWIARYTPSGTEPILNQGSRIVISSHVWKEQLLQNTLYTRGWVFQERLLAPRILHFSRNQVFFECASISACEVLPLGIPRMSGVRAAVDRHWRERLQYRFSDRSTHLSGTKDLSIEEFWDTVVATYTRCELTFGKDKVNALDGVATLVKAAFEQSLPTEAQIYRCGLWSKNLEEQLAWRVVDCRQVNGQPSFRPRPLRFPSWSWTSVDGVVETHDRFFAESRSYQVTDHDGLPIRFEPDTTEHILAVPSALTGAESSSPTSAQEEEQPALGLKSSAIKIRGYVGRGSFSWDCHTRHGFLQPIALLDMQYDVFLDQPPTQHQTECFFLVLAYSKNDQATADEIDTVQEHGELGRSEWTYGAGDGCLAKDAHFDARRTRRLPWTTYSGIGLILHEERPNQFTRAGVFNFHLVDERAIQGLTGKASLGQDCCCGVGEELFRDIYLF